MDNVQLLVDLHQDAPRQGPGGEEQTRLAITLSGLKRSSELKIADIGCGSGPSTLVLADALDAHVIAVDIIPEFLDKLADAASRTGVADHVITRTESMDELSFAEEELDAVWSEGAIYNMGFAEGIEAWRKYLKPGGILAVSELTWLTDERPEELQAYWDKEYPKVDIASAKLATLERLGFSPIGYFVLPENCWLDNYYRPLQKRFAGFLERHKKSDAARVIVKNEENEILLYEKYKDFVGYGYYIARKEQFLGSRL
ncbi:MAG: class I SAM-dependent methyltransferase [Synechococcus sp. SB0666_bin_14]|nr:class I SAM-dependent methyltransferase [Synechococcus sp. SB0666_bin_14]MYG46928.1 class I SAM-dependent methyltransferase [Synechococcus sp. SB0675_bin_6]